MKAAPTWIQNVMIGSAAALAYIVAFEVNDQFTAMILLTQGVALLYLPAGIKLLAILIGGWPAALGVGMALWYLSAGYWTQLSALALMGGAAISAGTTWIILTLMLHQWQTGTDLKKLSFTRLLMLDACASVIHGWLMNAYYWSQGVREASEIASSAWGMAFGDFMGSGLILLLMMAALRWSPLRHRLSH